MRIKGYFRQKPYVITDRITKGGSIPINGAILKIQDYPKILTFKSIQAAKDWVRENEK